jgi:hypothetical protein
MNEKQATPDPIGSHDGMDAFARGIVRRVQPARSVLSPWVQRWSEPGGRASGFAVQRHTTLTAERTSALVNRAQFSIGNIAIQRSSAVVMRPIAVAQRAGAVIRRLEGSAPKYEYRSGGYGVSVRTGFTLASPVAQASPQDEGGTGARSGGEFSTTESSLGFAPSPPQRLATFDSKKEPSLIERLQRRLSDAKALQTSGGQVAKKSKPQLAREETPSSSGKAASEPRSPVRPISRVEEIAPSASSKGTTVSRVDMKRVRVGEPRPVGIQRQAPEEEEALQAKPLVQRQAPEEEEALQAKPLVQRQTPEEEEALQAKPLVQRQAPEEEEALQAKPLVQRQAPEEEKETALKPMRVPLAKPMAVRSVQRLPRSEREQVPLPLVTPQVGHESSSATAQRKADDSARADTRLSPLPLVQRGASQEAGKVQRAEIPAATTVGASNASVDAAPGTTQIDLDDLARTIYSHVRRLFAVERERKSSIR